MDVAFGKEVRPLIDLIDSLRDIGVQNEISLPQIAVMGDQSSGKSSVLQSISGIPFPRGSGLVTRCPTQLIMTKSAPGSIWKGEISVSWSRPQPEECGEVDKIEDIADKIRKLADIITAGKLNGFSSESIVIKISSSESPDLTLIDLPGIVRTSTKGQDVGVIQQVNDLIESYIALPNTIILAVVPCNQDIATVDILERAARVDPNGLRTIGVLTKPDLIGPGSEDEVVQVLLNIRKPLHLGYIMVKNISQKQLNENVTLEEARAEEKTYFQTHPVFSQYSNRNLFGFNNLVVSLTKLLVSCIKRSIPGMIQDLKSILKVSREEITHLGAELPKNYQEQQALLMKKIAEYVQILGQSSRGEYRDRGGILVNEEFRLHAQIQKIQRMLQENIFNLRPVATNIVKADLFERLEQDIQNQKGRDLPGFINNQIFYSYIIDLVEEWRPIVEECKSDIVQQTLRVSAAISFFFIREYPELCNEIQLMSSKLIEQLNDEVTHKLEALILREQNPFTTQDVLLEVVNGIRFRTFDAAFRQILDSTDVKVVGDDINHLREDIRHRLGNWYMARHGVDSAGNKQEMVTLIQAYWDIASRRLADNFCMCMEMEFTTKFIRELESECVLYGIALDEAKIKEIMQEDPTISERRKYLKERIERLQTSVNILHKAAIDHLSLIVQSPQSHHNK